jgi:hypothetical protein
MDQPHERAIYLYNIYISIEYNQNQSNILQSWKQNSAGNIFLSTNLNTKALHAFISWEKQGMQH